MDNTTPQNNNIAKNNIGQIINRILFILWCIVVLIYPVLYSPQFTGAFQVPKEAVIIYASLFSLLLLGVRMLFDGAIRIKRTPLDLPVALFTLVIFLSSIFSVNRLDSIFSFVTFFALIIGFFSLLQIINSQKELLILSLCLLGGGCIISLLTFFSAFGIYLLPFAEAQRQSFTLLGSHLEQAIYLAIILPIGVFYSLKFIKHKTDNKEIIAIIATTLISFGLVSTIYILIKNKDQLLYLLPFETGFQIAFAAISQDAGRVFQGFFLGGGWGNFATDFTRFKLPTYNQNPKLWNIFFAQSSSFMLELIATTGILGLSTFLFIIKRALTQPKKIFKETFSAALVICFLIMFILPIGYSVLTLAFLILALHISNLGLTPNRSHHIIEIQTISIRRDLLGFSPTDEKAKQTVNNILTGIVSLFILSIVGFIGYFTSLFLISDYYFQQSLTKKNILDMYNLQIKALSIFPYQDAFLRSLSQTDFVMAARIAQGVKDRKISQNEQNQIYNLIQQSITSARNATTLAPLTAQNWQNLSQIYRGIIGFGQNAETFAIQTAQQAKTLDSTNPQEYISVGGIYYQLGQYDVAIQEFQQAINLKPDFPNAYYNLGHAYEMKKDYQNALAAYDIVKRLVAGDETSTKIIDSEIKALRDSLNSQNNTNETAENENTNETPTPTLSIKEKAANESLNVNSSPSAAIPSQNPKKKILPPKDTNNK